MGNCFAYARVSTPRQGERGVSLQEQKDAIERYASVHGLTVTRWFEDRESASRTGRTAFSEMLRLLRSKKVQGVIIHKIDRSARNLEDWADVGKLADSGVQVHFATENVDLKTVAGRLSADIQAVVAAHYSRNLREEVKKGFYGRLKQGFYPLRAPTGYLDQGSAKPKIFDPERSLLVREAFELYGSGRIALPELTSEMHRRGLRNRNNGAITLGGLAKLLKNPFYVGLIRIRNGGTFHGNHEPLVTTELFEKVQAVMAGKRVDRTKNRVFTYSRLIRCTSCGYSLIGETRKGHVYYRCHNRPFKTPAVCPPTSLCEEAIDAAVVAALATVDLSKDELELADTVISRIRNNFDETRGAAREALRLQQEHLHMRITKLTDLLIDGTIDNQVYAERRDNLLMEQARIKEKIGEIEGDPANVTAALEKTVGLAKSASLQYKTGPTEKKRELLKNLLSDLSASRKNVELTLALPFRLIAERQKSANGGPYRGTCRTWEEILKEILQPHKIEGSPAT